MSEELKHCPYCGSSDYLKVKRVDGETVLPDNFQVVCSWLAGGCGASGGVRRTQAEAIAAWNQRADDVPEHPVDNAQADSRERLEADVREICWGYDFYRNDAQKHYLYERGLDVREDIVTTNYDGHVLATVIMHLLDRQAAITRREFETEFLDRAEVIITRREIKQRELREQVDSLTAERDELKAELAECEYELAKCEHDLGELLDEKYRLKAERNKLHKQLAGKQHVIDVQRDSFAKMERECAELRRMLADAAEAI